MSKYIYISADTNDADYVTTFEEISDEALAEILPVIEAIKSFKPYIGKSKDGWTSTHDRNFPDNYREDLGERSVEELYGHIKGFEAFYDLVPRGEYGCHSIDEVSIFEVSDKKKLL